ncbi:MAG: hypothetical protein ABFE13_27775, partial [Phycisphaerales bacterium]
MNAVDVAVVQARRSVPVAPPNRLDQGLIRTRIVSGHSDSMYEGTAESEYKESAHEERPPLNSLREDISVAHKTIANWMDILERFYYHFRIYPYAHKKIK